MGMTIGEAGERAKCAPPTIRYYEEIGLLRPIARGANGRRTYGWPDVQPPSVHPPLPRPRLFHS